MATKEVILCDICDDQEIATSKCAVCGKDICDDHNFGGEYAYIDIGVMIYNAGVFCMSIKEPLIDCCPKCIDRLEKLKDNQNIRNIMNGIVHRVKEVTLKEINELK